MEEVAAPKKWVWREAMAEAVARAKKKLGITQSELAVELGVGREVMLWSRNPAPLPGYDYPRPGIGLEKAVELCQMAGFNDEEIHEMAAGWVEEGYWKSQREHLRTIRMLGARARKERWTELAAVALATLKLP